MPYKAPPHTPSISQLQSSSPSCQLPPRAKPLPGLVPYPQLKIPRHRRLQTENRYGLTIPTIYNSLFTFVCNYCFAGAYYYQTPEKGLNFEQTLLGVDKYAKDNNLPYRFHLLILL